MSGLPLAGDKSKTIQMLQALQSNGFRCHITDHFICEKTMTNHPKQQKGNPRIPITDEKPKVVGKRATFLALQQRT
jgi:hypothetical protein